MICNSSERWGSISIALHWLTAALIIGLAIVGLIMSELPTSPLKIQIYALHKSIGLTVLALTIIRLILRVFTVSPHAIATISRAQALTAKSVHGLLYALLFLMPLSGWLYNSASGFPLRWFGIVSLPRLFTGFNPTLKQFALATHENLFYGLVILLLAHTGAALYHHYLLGDNTLKRMLGKI